MPPILISHSYMGQKLLLHREAICFAHTHTQTMAPPFALQNDDPIRPQSRLGNRKTTDRKLDFTGRKIVPSNLKTIPTIGIQ